MSTEWRCLHIVLNNILVDPILSVNIHRGAPSQVRLQQLLVAAQPSQVKNSALLCAELALIGSGEYSWESGWRGIPHAIGWLVPRGCPPCLRRSMLGYHSCRWDRTHTEQHSTTPRCSTELGLRQCVELTFPSSASPNTSELRRHAAVIAATKSAMCLMEPERRRRDRAKKQGKL